MDPRRPKKKDWVTETTDNATVVEENAKSQKASNVIVVSFILFFI